MSTMASKSRIPLSGVNQENVAKKTFPMGQTRRAALGEIGNKVTLTRGTQPMHKSSLLPLKKSVVNNVDVKTSEKVLLKQDKPPVQVVKPVLKPCTTGSVFVLPGKTETRVKPALKEEYVKEHMIPESKEEIAFSSENIEDIDEEDKNNPILVSIYTKEIHEYLRSLELKFPIRKDFLTGQEVTPKMRCILVDWLVEVHQQFHLIQETLYMTVSIIDRFLQDFRTINTKTLQLVGVTAMFIASKYEEMYAPDIADFMYITDNTYTKKEILRMEMIMIKTLDYSFGRPLSLHFLRRYSKAGKALSLHHNMAKYFLEQCLVHYEVAHYPPSLIAAAAAYLAFFIIGSDSEDEDNLVWSDTLAHYSTYSKDEVLPVVHELAAIVVTAEKSKYLAVWKKYCLTKHMKISLRSELKSPTMVSLAKMKHE